MKISAKLLIVTLFMLSVIQAGAQENRKQAGFRFGNTTGFSARVITEDDFAFEGILGFRNGGLQLYGLFESRKPLYFNRIENMHLYFGGGVHVGFVRWNDYDKYYDPYGNDHYYDDYYKWHTGMAFGLDGIVGMEYVFQAAPISLAVDFKPFFEMYGPFLMRVNFWDFGFHMRYNF
ncbi:MAG TPA: hypothetical protein PLW31_13045 [Bacteroidales bacterium]|nr:hypothetical protein [Bacteroidales bacterium]HNQ83267.1 hypothetical protein [Bacteroidales bacterium]HOX78951.1 hypothetical protein [Bacteroidales bacterium]HPI87472.1 hypothetical protein [Bacteroidales bacterium]HPM92481.1 hypothetical protein [Bacteroidales bacterium]